MPKHDAVSAFSLTLIWWKTPAWELVTSLPALRPRALQDSTSRGRCSCSLRKTDTSTWQQQSPSSWKLGGGISSGSHHLCKPMASCGANQRPGWEKQALQCWLHWLSKVRNCQFALAAFWSQGCAKWEASVMFVRAPPFHKERWRCQLDIDARYSGSSSAALISSDLLATVSKYTSAPVVEIEISRPQSRPNHHVAWLQTPPSL